MLLLILLVVMASWFDNEDFSLAGLTQESHDVDIEVISSDEEPIDPEVNFKLLLKGTKALSNNISQISNFDDKILQLLQGQGHEGDTSLSEVNISQNSSISLSSSMASYETNFDVNLASLLCF